LRIARRNADPGFAGSGLRASVPASMYPAAFTPWLNDDPAWFAITVTTSSTTLLLPLDPLQCLRHLGYLDLSAGYLSQDVHGGKRIVPNAPVWG